jgi:hypothetical protein
MDTGECVKSYQHRTNTHTLSNTKPSKNNRCLKILDSPIQKKTNTMNQELNLVGTIRIFIKWWKHIAAMTVAAALMSQHLCLFL